MTEHVIPTAAIAAMFVGCLLLSTYSTLHGADGIDTHCR
jgi:hypothetical protein